MSHENTIVASTTDKLEDVIAAADATAEQLEEGRPPEVAESVSPETLEAAAENPEERQQDLERSQRPQRRSGIQKRIDKLVRRNYELEERLQQIERGARNPEPVGEKPRAEDFRTYDEFNEKLADWKAAQRVPQIQDPPYVPQNAREPEYVPPHEIERQVNERAEVRARELREGEQQQQMLQAHQANIEHARKMYPDFDEVTAATAKVQIPAALVSVVPQLPNSGQVVYILSKEPAFAAELAHLAKIGRSDLAVAKVAMLSAHLEAQAANAGQRSEGHARKLHSQASAPITPVRNSATSSGTDLGEADYQTFKRVRQQQEKNRYRR